MIRGLVAQYEKLKKYVRWAIPQWSFGSGGGPICLS